MPQFIAPIIMAAAAATTAGVGIYSAVNQPGQPKGPTPEEITKGAMANETSNRDAAVKQASQLLPGLQYNTSGGLSPDAYQTFAADFSGNANLSDSPQFQQMIARFLGLDSGASFGGNSPFGSSSPASPGLTG